MFQQVWFDDIYTAMVWALCGRIHHLDDSTHHTIHCHWLDISKTWIRIRETPGYYLVIPSLIFLHLVNSPLG